MTIAPKVAVDHFNSARFRVTVSHPAFGVFEQWIDKTPADDMDGGVTAALIEQEAERGTRGTATDSALARYWLKEYDRAEARAEKAEDRADDAHNLIVALRADLAATEARAEQAERMAALWKEVARRAVQDQSGLRLELSLTDARAEDAEKERDEAVERAEKHRRAEGDHRTNARCWMKTSEEWQATAEEWEKRALAAESRPLTPDAITGAMAARAMIVLAKHGYRPGHTITHEALAAALTEPPKRPEGAEELGELIGTWTATEDIAPAQLPTGSLATLADFLAERGVRVVGEDGSE